MKSLRVLRTSFSFKSLSPSKKKLALFRFIVLRRLCSTMGNPEVFFDVSASKQPLGRIVMEVSFFRTSCNLNGHGLHMFLVCNLNTFNTLCIVVWGRCLSYIDPYFLLKTSMQSTVIS